MIDSVGKIIEDLNKIAELAPTKPEYELKILWQFVARFRALGLPRDIENSDWCAINKNLRGIMFAAFLAQIYQETEEQIPTTPVSVKEITH